jgi:hypothetical protein
VKQLTLESLNEALTELAAICKEKGVPVSIENPKINVYFSEYALPEACYIPKLGIVCKDQAALERYLAKVEVARLRCE